MSKQKSIEEMTPAERLASLLNYAVKQPLEEDGDADVMKLKSTEAPAKDEIIPPPTISAPATPKAKKKS